jgi:hypothetical protein
LIRNQQQQEGEEEGGGCGCEVDVDSCCISKSFVKKMKITPIMSLFY